MGGPISVDRRVMEQGVTGQRQAAAGQFNFAPAWAAQRCRHRRRGRGRGTVCKLEQNSSRNIMGQHQRFLSGSGVRTHCPSKVNESAQFQRQFTLVFKEFGAVRYWALGCARR